jgi:ribosomal protein S30
MYWWRREDSNLRHGAYETPALPPELRRRVGDRAENLQAYERRVKRASVV